MKYYIEPAEQTPEVQEQLKAITPTSLNPEEITLLDPACGSGHILVEAYDLFKAIYQERGYRAKDIPSLILQKNLFGLEIDDRAAQLAAFALMMKARADDRRIFKTRARCSRTSWPFRRAKGWTPGTSPTALNAPILKEKLPPSEYLFEEMEEAKARCSAARRLAEQGHVAQTDVATPARVVRGRQDVRLTDPGAAEAGGEVAGDRAAGQGRGETRRFAHATAAMTLLPLVEQAATAGTPV